MAALPVKGAILVALAKYLSLEENLGLDRHAEIRSRVEENDLGERK